MLKFSFLTEFSYIIRGFTVINDLSFKSLLLLIISDGQNKGNCQIYISIYDITFNVLSSPEVNRILFSSSQKVEFMSSTWASRISNLKIYYIQGTPHCENILQLTHLRKIELIRFYHFYNSSSKSNFKVFLILLIDFQNIFPVFCR